MTPEADLAVRAARLLQQATGSHLGATLRVHKRIPLGGGLGGGSSDAATVLLALNELWGTGLSSPELAGLGLPLGRGCACFCSRFFRLGGGGRRAADTRNAAGEVVRRHPPRGRREHPEVFQSPELTRNSPVITIRAFLESGGRNDCEPVVRARAPEVAEALDWLAQFAPAHLTGTGSCVFAACESAAAAERLAARVPDRWMSFVARGLNISPVHERLSTGRRG